MLTFIAGLFTAYVVTWQAIGILFVLGILFEHSNWRGFAVFTAIVSSVAAYFYFEIPAMTMAAYAGGYLAVGLCWSVWRYKRHVDFMVAEAVTSSQPERERVAAKLLPSAMWDTIVAWIIVWPFSFVENFTKDIIDTISALVRRVFKGMYNRIYDSAVAKLKLQ